MLNGAGHEQNCTERGGCNDICMSEMGGGREGSLAMSLTV